MSNNSNWISADDDDLQRIIFILNEMRLGGDDQFLPAIDIKDDEEEGERQLPLENHQFLILEMCLMLLLIFAHIHRYKN